MNVLLYKMNSNFEILYWTVKVQDCKVVINWGTCLQTTAGPQIPDRIGSKQLAEETLSTPEEAIAKANSLAREKINRKGYSTKVPRSVPMLPMLANTYNPHNFKMEKFAIQPKLDGYRCIATNTVLKSRLNSVINSVPHINEALKGLPDGYKLDGELYIHGCDLQTIGSYVKRDRPHVDSYLIEYHIFDLVAQGMTFEERYTELCRLYLEIKEAAYTHDPCIFPIKFVPTSFYDVNEIENVKTLLKKAHETIASDYEGIIIRDCEGIYELNKRSSYLLKYKEFQDGEFEIVNVEERSESTAVLVVKTGNTTTDVAIKTSTINKKAIWKNRENYVGRWAKVKFQKTLPSGKLFQPVCIDVYTKKEDAK